MLIRIITLRFSAAVEGFDDAPLTAFIKDKSVLSLREHFFMRNEVPYLAVVVIYEPVLETVKSQTSSKQKQRDESWRDLLKDKDMPLFDSLRSWRAERCKQEGIPPYVICNNKELARLVLARPQNLAGLLQLEGFGQGKVEKYGKELLALLGVNNEK